MQPQNFPGRINARRLGALKRIERQLAAGTKTCGDATLALTADDRSRLTSEANALGLRLVADAQARSIRSKKTKALGWTVARQAWRSGKLSA